MKNAFVAFFILFQVQAQEILFKGKVLDAGTNKAIPYVNLSFLNTLKGTSTDESGDFYLDIPKGYLGNKIHVSSLGYKDTIVVASSIYKAQKILLVEESFALDEVVVRQDLEDFQVLNPIGSYSITSGFSSSETPWILALYFPNIGRNKKYLKKVTVFVQNNTNFNRNKSKFRLRIFDVNPSTKEPAKDLLYKSVVLDTYVDQDFVSIDMTALQIKMPKEGLYVGLEWLFVPANWYTTTLIHSLTDKKVVEDRFSPTFAGVYTRNQNYKTMIYGVGEWQDFKMRSKSKSANFIPAISLKVSKE